MKKIVLATNNAKKLNEMRAILDKELCGRFELISLNESGFEGDIAEDADSFEGNAYIKAGTVHDFTGLSVIADDSGLEVDYLGGAPGIYSARYAGEGSSDDEKIDKILRELEGVPFEKRTARFVSVICAVDEKGVKRFCRGECEGYILEERRGSGRFGYDPIFYYPEFGKTFAELEGEQKNGVSHRGRAIEKLVSLILDSGLFS